MASKIIILSILIGFFVGSLAESCKNPKVNAMSFTSQDATIVSHIGYIAEFTLSCDNPIAENYALYAEIDNKVHIAARTAPNKYQVSWTEEIASAKSGTREIRLLDEAGWAELRRARRSEPNAPAVPLFAIQLHHPGSYSGPWVNSEAMATVLSIIVAYIAIRNKNQLLS